MNALLKGTLKTIADPEFLVTFLIGMMTGLSIALALMLLV